MNKRMKRRRPRSDDVLFISALAAVLLGIGLLLYTTRILEGASGAWSILVMAAGGVLVYFALARGSSIYILFGGMLFALEGAFIMISSLAGWRPAQSWPLAMAAVGAAELSVGAFRAEARKVRYLVPSLGFLGLGAFFALFSFKWIRADFSEFIAAWWPTAIIIGGVCLFAAYGASRRTIRRSKPETEGPGRGAASRETGRRASGRAPGP
jgi:hypothetical protein